MRFSTHEFRVIWSLRFLGLRRHWAKSDRPRRIVESAERSIERFTELVKNRKRAFRRIERLRPHVTQRRGVNRFPAHDELRTT